MQWTKERPINDGSDSEIELENLNSKVSSEPEVIMTDSDEGDYLLVTNKTKHSTKNYVGKVERMKDGHYSMIYLRKQSESSRKFVLLSIADCDTISQGFQPGRNSPPKREF